MDRTHLTLIFFRYLPYLIWNLIPQKGVVPPESNLGPFAHQSLDHPWYQTACDAGQAAILYVYRPCIDDVFRQFPSVSFCEIQWGFGLRRSMCYHRSYGGTLTNSTLWDIPWSLLFPQLKVNIFNVLLIFIFHNRLRKIKLIHLVCISQQSPAAIAENMSLLSRHK